MTKTATVDPWLLNSDGTPDPFASNIDWNMPDLPDPDEPLPSGDPVLEQPVLQPEVITTPPLLVVEDEEPETFELEDGTQLTLTKEKGWWVGSVVGQTGSAQRYKGQTKNQLIVEILKAQANATKKIREQNLELKLGKAPKAKPEPQPQQAPAPATNRQLTADELFEIKTQLESNPELALDNLFQKKTGMNINQLVALAQQGAQKGNQANNVLVAEQATKTFLQNNPDFYGDPEWENFKRIVKWVSRFKLGESVKKGEEEQAFDRLVSSGNWTVDNIEEAFSDLSSDDLLIKAPRTAPPPPPPVADQSQNQPAPRPDPRIVSTVVRPRAALGLRPGDVTPVRPPEPQNAPSAEDFDNMTDAEVAATMAAIRRHRAQSRRSN